MKKRFSFHKEQIVIVHQALRKALETCECYWSDLDQCHSCVETQLIYDQIDPIVETYLKHKQAPIGHKPPKLKICPCCRGDLTPEHQCSVPEIPENKESAH